MQRVHHFMQVDWSCPRCAQDEGVNVQTTYQTVARTHSLDLNSSTVLLPSPVLVVVDAPCGPCLVGLDASDDGVASAVAVAIADAGTSSPLTASDTRATLAISLITLIVL